MHPSSMENMQRCVDWYGPESPSKIVDLGASDVNGSYRQLFAGHHEFTGVDLAPGPGVDLVLEDPYVLPFEDGAFDLVLSGQMLEHCAHFWRTFAEIARIMKPGGLAFIIAPSGGPIHRYPVDCYRFYPDAYQALADWTDLRLVHCWMDDRGPWRDLVGVFQKGGDLQAIQAPLAQTVLPVKTTPHPDPAAERTAGARPYLDVLREMHDILKPQLYLEIGVRLGHSLELAQCESIAIDPSHDLEQVPENTRLFETTSDDFFFFHAEDAITKPVDLAFIDGMHLIEFAYRDFMNLEAFMSAGGTVIIDDILPCHPLQARRDRQTQVWTGDVWRLLPLLERLRPDLELTLFDTAPTGLLMIRKLKPRNPRLKDRYNPELRAILGEPADPPRDLIDRSQALAPTSENLRRVLGVA
ncbi:methyltransferase domain-containing protein [Maricaulis sp.]|uniref:methyltransferase domain-containing protein n=1 Tax=Maricaulis sp. TaxID=1486257 RepID=UPI002626B9EF|nr:methyltransferase domain-containing protein [Maricaulis sp.]